MVTEMNGYIDALKCHATENLPNYVGGDTQSILDMLYCCYHECNSSEKMRQKTHLRICTSGYMVCPSRKRTRLSMLFALSARMLYNQNLADSILNCEVLLLCNEFPDNHTFCPKY